MINRLERSREQKGRKREQYSPIKKVAPQKCAMTGVTGINKEFEKYVSGLA